MELNEKKVLITGASTGIGYQLALQMARKGARVAVVARSEDKLQALRQEIETLDGTAIPMPADVSRPEPIYQTVEDAAAQLGGLDLVIANAGVGILMPAHKMKPHHVDRMLQVNLQGAIHTLLAGLKLMVDSGGGHLVGISSLARFRGLPSSAVYSATKSGLITFMESLRVDYKRKNIRVTTICPGFVHTPMTETVTQPMPFALSAEQAGAKIIRAIEAEKKLYCFPTPLGYAVRLLHCLPNLIYDPLVGLSR